MYAIRRWESKTSDSCDSDKWNHGCDVHSTAGTEHVDMNGAFSGLVRMLWFRTFLPYCSPFVAMNIPTDIVFTEFDDDSS